MEQAVTDVVAYYGKDEMIYLSGVICYLFITSKKKYPNTIFETLLGAIISSQLFKLVSLMLPPNFRFIIPLVTTVPVIAKFMIINLFD